MQVEHSTAEAAELFRANQSFCFYRIRRLIIKLFFALEKSSKLTGGVKSNVSIFTDARQRKHRRYQKRMRKRKFTFFLLQKLIFWNLTWSWDQKIVSEAQYSTHIFCVAPSLNSDCKVFRLLRSKFLYRFISNQLIASFLSTSPSRAGFLILSQFLTMLKKWCRQAIFKNAASLNLLF